MSNLQELAFNAKIKRLPLILQYKEWALDKRMASNEAEWRELMAQKIRESVSEGRTGQNFPCIIETLSFDEDMKMLEMRYDDYSNPEFWLQSRFPMKRILDHMDLSSLKEYIEEREQRERLETDLGASDSEIDEFLENMEEMMRDQH